MFVRKGEALGSVHHERFAELQATESAAPETAEPAEGDGTSKPYDPKSDWVDWAVGQGVDRDEAEALTKNELIELYG